MSIETVINLLVSATSCIVAVVALILSIRNTRKKDVEKSVLYAPLLHANAYYSYPRKEYTLWPGYERAPNQQCFSLERRAFAKVGNDEPELMYSLYINATDTNTDDTEDLIGIGKIRVENIGYEFLVAEITSIRITLQNSGKVLEILPSKDAKGKNVRNTFPTFGGSLDLVVSFRHMLTGSFIMFDAKKPGPEVKGKDILNMLFPAASACDLWKEICMTLGVTNSQGVTYKQEMHITMEDYVISSSSNLLSGA